jgi:hypothetical protein
MTPKRMRPSESNNFLNLSQNLKLIYFKQNCRHYSKPENDEATRDAAENTMPCLDRELETQSDYFTK